MKKEFLVLIALFFISRSVFAQFFFIPIIVPNTYVPFSCPPLNQQAYDYYKSGIEKIKSKELEVAIIYFKGSIAKDSLFCDAYEALTYCYRSLNQPKNALDIINLSLKANASNYSAQKTKGYILLMDLKDYDQSANYFLRQSNTHPDNPLWLYYLTESLIGLNMLDSAKTTALKTQMIYQNLNNPDALEYGMYLQGIIAYKEGNYEGAVRGFKLITNNYKNDPEYNCFYGISL
jgi:tetratricopeptide (TPR) repeat protein